MAAKKQTGKKKATKKPTSKSQSRAKLPKVSKAKAKRPTPKDAAGEPRSEYLAPFRVGSTYWAIVEALKSLGVDKMHSFAEITPAVECVMGEYWKAFAEKDARNDETGKDAEHRVLQNVSVLARQDYGKPLRERGYEVRRDGREKLAGLLKIRSK